MSKTWDYIIPGINSNWRGMGNIICYSCGSICDAIGVWRRIPPLEVILVGVIMDRMGGFTDPGHKVWEWRLDNDKMRLLYIKRQVMDIYKLS